jgi:hypothetical protein
MRRAGWPESRSSLHSLAKKLAASGIIRQMKYWEIVADKLSAART